MGQVGVEPTPAFADDILSVARIPVPPLTRIKLKGTKAWGGIEPPYKSFADSWLTTCLPGHCFFEASETNAASEAHKLIHLSAGDVFRLRQLQNQRTAVYLTEHVPRRIF